MISDHTLDSWILGMLQDQLSFNIIPTLTITYDSFKSEEIDIRVYLDIIQ